MGYRCFDFDLKGNWLGFVIAFHRNENVVSVKTLSGEKKQLEDEFYEYRKTFISDDDIILEYAIIKNYGTISRDYIKVRVNRFVEQTKANEFEIRY